MTTAWPKWMYRKHPMLGHFDRTLVLDEKAHQALLEEGNEQVKADGAAGTQWTAEAAGHGFTVRPASLMHASHVTPNHHETPLHEAVSQVEIDPSKVTAADISMVTAGDLHA